MTEMFRNLLLALWNATQMIFVVALAVFTVIMVIYLFYRLISEAKKGKANNK